LPLSWVTLHANWRRDLRSGRSALVQSGLTVGTFAMALPEPRADAHARLAGIAVDTIANRCSLERLLARLRDPSSECRR
jgi:hypothetical protein